MGPLRDACCQILAVAGGGAGRGGAAAGGGMGGGAGRAGGDRPARGGAPPGGRGRARAALRGAGRRDGLRAAGVAISDAGDLPVTPFAADPGHPGARNLAAVVTVARRVAAAVASELEAGRLPLVAGG